MSIIEVDAPFKSRPSFVETSYVRVSSLPVGHAWRASGLVESQVTALAAIHGTTPPIVVNRRDMTIVDGAHRVAAARRLGAHAVAVEWFDGSLLDAFHEFVSRNSRDGLPLTHQDREAGVVRALGAEPSWSDRRIAQLCGVSPKMVARLRCDRSQQTECVKRVGRDGRARPVRPGAMRQRIAEAIEQDPCASLRAIASQLGVSPETVRSVRKELGGRPRADQPSPSVVTRPRDLEAEYLLVLQRRQPPAPWRDDNAFDATTAGQSFVDWFESSAVDLDDRRVDDVPLSRVYEIADEARRRASFWSSFADSLELRTRRRR